MMKNLMTHMVKAKRKEWHELPKEEQWISGYYVKAIDDQENPIHVIFDPTTTLSKLIPSLDLWEEIDENTLCRALGYTDEKERWILENDIVSFEDVGEDGYEVKEGFDFTNMAQVYFDEEEGRWSLKNFIEADNSAVASGEEDINQAFFTYCKIVGNIFDNPKILEKEAFSETKHMSEEDWTPKFADS